MEDFVSKLKQDVQCSLCNDTLTEPKILKCYHTFCKPCIKRHAELIEQVNVFKCPQCKSETPLPELNSVDDLKPSVLHSRMVKVLEFVESEKVCSVFGSHPPASWHCIDCNHSLCDECEKGHSIFTKDHKVISLSKEVTEEDIKVLLTRTTRCEDHVDNIVKLFCIGCEEVICLECLKHDHEGHSIIPLSTHAKKKRALLSEKLEKLKTRQQTMEKKFKAMQEVTKELRETGEEEKQKIKKKLEETIKQLQMKATELMKQIDDDVEKAERMTAKGQSVLDQTRGAMEYMKTLIEKGNQTDVIQVEYMDHDDDNILESNEQIEKIQHLGKFFEFNKELWKEKDSGLGTLRKMETDYKMSTVEVQGELQAYKKSKLIISTKSKNGKLTRHITDIIDIKISPKENVEIKENYERTDGKIEVEFMAKVAGQLTAEVQVNGNHVSNSPLKISITKEFKIKGMKTKSSDFTGIAVNKDNSRIAVADQSAHCVYICNTNGDLLLTYTNVRSPQGISFLNNTDLVIADYNNHRICIVNTIEGTLKKTFGSQGSGTGQFLCPQSVHVDDDGNIIVCDLGNHRIQVFNRDGNYGYQFGLTEEEKFCPVSAVTKRGRFYVSDYTKNVILVFEKKDGLMTRTSTIGGCGSAVGQLHQPWGLAIDNDHRLLVCDRASNRIQEITLYCRLISHETCSCASPKYLAVLDNNQLIVTSQKSVVIYADRK